MHRHVLDADQGAAFPPCTTTGERGVVVKPTKEQYGDRIARSGWVELRTARSATPSLWFGRRIWNNSGCQDPKAVDLGSGLLGLNPRVQPGRRPRMGMVAYLSA